MDDDLTDEELKDFEHSLDKGTSTNAQKLKPKLYLHIDWIASAASSIADVRNKFISPQTQQPIGVNYQPPAPTTPKKNYLPLIAGVAALCLMGILIYQKTR